MPVILTEQDVRTLLDMPAAIRVVEESLQRQAAGDGWIHPRRRLALPERVFLNYMFAADQKAGWMGAKLYSVAHGVARFIVLLYRADSGELAACEAMVRQHGLAALCRVVFNSSELLYVD